MKTKIIFLILLFAVSISNAQKEAAHWYFGYYSGLDFNSGKPVSKRGSLATREGCASISTSSGNLQFYTDGSTIWNRNHDVMQNSEDLLGNASSTQSALIVPLPDSNRIYYVFTVDNAEYSPSRPIKQGLNYSIVDMSLNGGLGGVTSEKNKHLITYRSSSSEQKEWKCSEKMAAVLDESGSAYWLVTHFIDTFYAFKIDASGINETPVESKSTDVINTALLDLSTGKFNSSAVGYLKISPDGKKLAIAHSSTTGTFKSGKVLLYDFNSATGTVSSTGIPLISSGTYPYGVEFSPKSKKLYVSVNNYDIIRGDDPIFNNSTIFQFDLEAANIRTSKVSIYVDNTIIHGALQLAMDGKIYRAKSVISARVGERSLGAINKPELSGSACDYDHKAVKLSDTNSGYGLPPFISSFFLFSFDFEFTCFGDATHFFITSDETYDSLLWDFGDGSTSTETEPYHTYSSPGSYTVTFTTTTNNVVSDPIRKTVRIIDKVPVVSTPYELYECDGEDSNSTDGITTFNLELANGPVSNGNESDVTVYYYSDPDVMNNDTDLTNSLQYIYRNTKPDQLIYAKVMSLYSDCYSYGEVILKTTSTTSFTMDPFVGCDLGTGTATFDLSTQKPDVISKLNLTSSSDTTITFHISKDNASIGYQPLNETFTSNSKTIYIRVENNDMCYGIGELNLETYSLPQINLEDESDICHSQFPYKIDAAIDSGDISNYSYQWNTGENTHEIEILTEGIYSVQITDNNYNCSMTRIVTIRSIEKPDIENIIIDPNTVGYTATIDVKGNDEFLYSIDDLTDSSFQLNDSFSNLFPGRYTAYVKDAFQCNTVEKEFYIFGFPKFFTPNQDGINDVWEIKGYNLDEFSYSEIVIFDRYGKHLATIDPNSSWNGIYNGNMLNSGEFWFSINVTDNNNITITHKGHFSLVRR